LPIMEDWNNRTRHGRLASSLTPQGSRKFPFPLFFFCLLLVCTYVALQTQNKYALTPFLAFCLSILQTHRYKNFKLPGLEKYTPDQLFFISFGRVWCSKERPEYLMQLIRGNAHPPWKWRANGSIQNSREFAQAFGCPVGVPMNPPQKCEVW
jgi:predicted metalloendopeptidase